MTTPNNTVASLPRKWRTEAATARKVAETPKSTESGITLCVIAENMEQLANELESALAARSPAPSAGVGVDWAVLQIGATGSAYDPPDTHRAFTYERQPGSVIASKLGGATIAAASASAGDSIDRGLSLLKALQEAGFGVFQVAAIQHPTAPSVSPAYDRELIARMLDDPDAYSVHAVEEQTRLLREADNAEAANIRTVNRSPAVAGDGLPDREAAEQPQGEMVLVPRSQLVELQAEVSADESLAFEIIQSWLSAAPSRPVVDEDAIKSAYEAWCLPRMSNIEPDHPSDAFRAGYTAAIDACMGEKGNG